MSEETHPVFSEGRDDLLIRHKESLAEIFHAISKESKLMILHELAKGSSLSDIKEEAQVSGSTAHNYVDDLNRANLIDKSEGYQVTDLGAEVLMCGLFLASVKQYMDRKRVFHSQPQVDRSPEEYGELHRLTYLDEASDGFSCSDVAECAARESAERGELRPVRYRHLLQSVKQCEASLKKWRA